MITLLEMHELDQLGVTNLPGDPVSQRSEQERHGGGRERVPAASATATASTAAATIFCFFMVRSRALVHPVHADVQTAPHRRSYRFHTAW